MKCVWCRNDTTRLAYVAHREGCPCVGSSTPCRMVAVCEECEKENERRAQEKWLSKV